MTQTVQTSFVVSKHQARDAKVNKNIQFENIDAWEYSKCTEIIGGTAIDKNNYQVTENGFVYGITEAYNQHHHVTIRPDDVWIAILSQFSIFVETHAEELRSKFVAHDGKKDIVVRDFGTLRTANYGRLAQLMTKEMDNHITDKNLKQWILPDFTTTTVNDTIVASVQMMATMQKYFSYKFCLMCGIPSVTLLGTTEDWIKLRMRINKFSEYGSLCTKWGEMLKNVLDEFVAASEGRPNIDFWSRVCHFSGGGSGPSYLSGWLTAFCVWGTDGTWYGDRQNGDSIYPKIDVQDIPHGFSKVPVIVDDNGTEYKTMMFAGHSGYMVEEKNRIVFQPTWSIALVN